MIILLVLILFFQFVFVTPELVVSAEYDKTYYARVMYDNVFLYKSPLNIDDYSNTFFILPRTYFVQLIDSENEFFKVKYLSTTGYVKKENVQTIVGTPITPYLDNISFRIYSEQSRSLRTEPTEQAGSASLITYIPLYSRNLTYYGKIEGQSLIDDRTNIWYYCKYTAEKDYYGYVYSDFCDQMTKFSENTENVSYTTNPSFTETKPSKSLKMENNSTKIIIAILCVPALIFVFMILKSSVILNKEKRNNKEIKEY